jgi:transmembrane sensor
MSTGTAGAAQAALAAAVDWQVRLTSGSAGAGEHEAFARWLAADAHHQAAWQRVQGVLAGPVRQLQDIDQRSPGQLPAARQSLSPAAPPASRQRRRIAGGTAMLLASLGAGYLVHRSQPLTGLLADLQTGTAETRHVVLPDGSALDLSARSAADLRFGAEHRLVRLREGELLVQVARDAAAAGQPARPFVVQTRHGTAQALGTRYLVRQEARRTLVVVLQHSVALQTGQGVSRTLSEGQAAWMDGQGIELIGQRMAHHAGWAEGVLDVRDAPLSEAIEALRPWRRGLLRISPAAARLRVFGVFRLNDIDQALQALVDTQPIRITTYGPMLTSIDLLPARAA